MSEYSWIAQYNDGEFLPQYEWSKGSIIKENKYGDIDRKRLIAFELVAKDRDNFCIWLEPGQRLIYRRRSQLNVSMNQTVVFHLVGWQHTINGQNIQSMLLIHPSGDIEMIGKWKEDHVLYCAPILIEAEKVS